MAEDSPDELEMILEYDEEEVSSSDNGGLLGPFEYEPLPREGEEDENVGDAVNVDPTRLTRIDW